MLTAPPSSQDWPKYPHMTYQALILRNPVRAEAIVQEFDQLGITSWCAQLIETIWPTDRTELEAMTRQLLGGTYQWLVITSVNTVRAVEQLLAGRTLPQELRIAAVGQKTSEAIKRYLGRPADFQPVRQSAAGMIDTWKPEQGARICYPHGDLASMTLSNGLAELSVSVDEFIAYETVSAGSGGVPLDAGKPGQFFNVLQAHEISEKLEDMDLVIFSAPSVARRFADIVDGSIPQSVRTIAIGQPTATAMEQLRIPVHAIASVPTPQGLAQAATDLLQRKS